LQKKWEPLTYIENYQLDFLTSSLMRGIYMGEISKLGWLIGLVEHAMWADSLYFLYLLLLSTSKILAGTKLGSWNPE
jgi:hypothetical protein